MDSAIAPERIDDARQTIDPIFRDTPQFECEPLTSRLGLASILKVECVNPIRSFKGRGACHLLSRLPADPQPIVCASAGNFGQGMAYACGQAGRRLTVFAATTANPLKLERMRALGAAVVLSGADFDEAKAAAAAYAERRGELFVEDGRVGAVGEGAATIAVELMKMAKAPDAVVVPVGNGSLINGMGVWLKHRHPSVQVIGAVAASAPAMEMSWRAGKPITAASSTIADGIAVRVPVPEAVDIMRRVVDDVVLVSDDEMLGAIRFLFEATGLVVEPAGAAGVAALIERATSLRGRRVAAVLTGANVTVPQLREWLLQPGR